MKMVLFRWAHSESVRQKSFPSISVFSWMLWLMLQCPRFSNAVCDPNTGPAGSYDCFLGYRYSGYQWGTCLSDAYIIQKSKGQYLCEDRTRTYCYYQCMLEVHGALNGTVTPDCACDPTKSTVSPSPYRTTLSPECYSPPGTDCNWYRNCLEKKFPCAGGADDYGIAYAEKFCNAYSNAYNTFSSKGRLWVDAVRRCLQVALVPLMRDFVPYTCADVKSFAFKSHASCYLQPDNGAPSICDLPQDYRKVFWTIKSAFLSAFSNSMFGMFEVSKGCLTLWGHQLGSSIQQLKIRLQLALSRSKRDLLSVSEVEHRTGMTLRRSDGSPVRLSEKDLLTDQDPQQTRIVKRQAMNDTNYWQGETNASLYYHNLAGSTADAMARQLNWTASGVTWFAYGQAVDIGSLNVYILLADRVAYDSGYSSLSPRPNMTEVVTQAGQAFENGDIKIELEGRVVQLRTLDACSDVECQEVFLKVSAPPSSGQETNHPTPWKIMMIPALVAIFFAIML